MIEPRRSRPGAGAKSVIALLAAAVLGASAGDARSACALRRAAQSLPEGVALWTDEANRVALYVAQVRRDDDGAANAYHPCGGNFADAVCADGVFGLDHICSGAQVRDAANQPVPPSEPVPGADRRSSARCLRTYREARDAGFPVCGAGKACVGGWPGIVLAARTPQVPGLAERIPALRPAGDPFAGYFISQTKLSRPDPKAPDGRSAYVDSRTAPYIVVPGASVLTGADFGFGSSSRADLALVIERQPQGPARAVFAVIADTGPRGQIGEGSLALLGRLQGHAPSELDADRPQAAPLPSRAFPSLATYILFANSGRFLQGLWPERDLAAADIAAAGQKALESVGGVAALAGCPGVPADPGALIFVKD
ncbi:MAG: hypothetical protein ABSG83_21705 [Roseiarcus sp.]